MVERVSGRIVVKALGVVVLLVVLGTMWAWWSFRDARQGAREALRRGEASGAMR